MLPTQATRRLVLVSAKPDILRRALAAIPNSEVVVVFDNGCEVRLKENQRLEIDSRKPCAAMLVESLAVPQPPGPPLAGYIVPGLIGIGVHTGVAYVGTVQGIEGAVTDFTALGDNVNITARLASMAQSGEALISDAAYAAAGLDLGDLARRELELEGKAEHVNVRVLEF